jgi:hypothetical protein
MWKHKFLDINFIIIIREKIMIKSLVLTFLLLHQPETLVNKVDGLELPKPIVVKTSEGFVVVEAKCKGTVKWLLVSEGKTKYLENNTNNSVTVAVPQSGEVTVFAIGLVDSKMTDFAVTTISTEKPVVKPKNPPKKKEPELEYRIKW